MEITEYLPKNILSFLTMIQKETTQEFDSTGVGFQ